METRWRFPIRLLPVHPEPVVAQGSTDQSQLQLAATHFGDTWAFRFQRINARIQRLEGTLTESILTQLLQGQWEETRDKKIVD